MIDAGSDLMSKGKGIMGDFLRYFLETPIFSLIAMIVFLSIMFVFIYNRIYKYALIFGLLFCIAFGIFMTGPMGEELINKFKRRQPTFQFPDQEEIDEARKRIRDNQ